MATGTIYLRPIADVSLGHSLYPAESTAGYLLINEEICDEDSTYIYLDKSGNQTGAVNATSSFKFGGNISDFRMKISNVEFCVNAKAIGLYSNDYVYATITVDGSILVQDRLIGNPTNLYSIFSKNVDELKYYINEYLVSNNYSKFPDITVSIMTKSEGDGSSNKGAPSNINVSTLYLKIEYVNYISSTKKMGKEWIGIKSSYKKLNGQWAEILEEDEFKSLISQNIYLPDREPTGVRTLPIFASGENWKMSRDLSTITEIRIVNSYSVTGLESDSWAADIDGSGGIMCYINGTVLTIVSDNAEGICISPYQSWTNTTESGLGIPTTTYGSLFGYLSALTSVSGMGLLHFYDGDDITRLFCRCSKLVSTDFEQINGLNNIGDYAFNSCSALTSITIPSSVTSIGHYAFAYCDGLTNITIPSSVTSIGSYAFAYCSALTNITIPSSVTSIGIYAFAYCDGLTNITIPSSVTSIGSSAFASCSGLGGTIVTIPSSVTSIGLNPWHGCGILSISVDSGNAHYHVDGDCLISTKSNEVVCGFNNSTIPSYIITIGGYAFAYCDGLTNITIPSNVTSIGIYAFCNCSALTNITIPSSVTSIGSYAFAYCSALTSITIPSSVTSIGHDAFTYCDGLTSITIPSNVTSIGSYAFAYCENLTTANVLATTPPEAGTTIFSSSIITQIVVPSGCSEAYKAASGWSTFADKIVEA